MLISLHVKNLALIEESEVYFLEGLNILTGETGAGKSIIIGSIHLALGAKAGKECIRTGAEYALVELIFSSEKKEVLEKMQELELPMESDGTILIQRKILPGRSICKVNGETIGSRQLKEIASLLIDIHGQNDTQTLLNVKRYSEILDDFAGEAIDELKREMAEKYDSYMDLKKKIKEAKEQESSRDKELALAEFEVQEIKQANLQPSEDIHLEEQYRKMNNSKKIAEAIAKANQAVGGETDGNAGEQVSYALRELKNVSSYDPELTDLEDELTQIDNLLNDFNRHITDYLSELEFEPEEFRMVENRLDVCNHIKSKYGNTVEEVLAYMEKQNEKIVQLSDLQAYMESLNQKMIVAEEQVMDIAAKLSEIRNEYARILSSKLSENLKDLNFLNVEFNVDVESDKENLTREGIDSVDFLVSFNPGEPIKSLSQVASGGELSRFMLALKSIMADKEQTQTLIFDEIDAGISGKTAWNVSEKMPLLGKEHQLICITHLPQIAAMADSHFVIEKELQDNSTVTQIRELNEEESLGEIARLLGTSQITPAVLANAKELKEMANHTKRY